MPKKEKAIKPPKKLSSKDLKVIEETAVKLLALMGFEEAKIKLAHKEDLVRLDIESSEAGLLIGNHGEVILSLQLILSLMCYKKFKYWYRLIVNVNDWLERRTEDLKTMALNASQKVKFSGEEMVMPFLSSYERRVIHLTLADNPDVITESVGEDRNRRLVIKAKTGKEK